ncbi:MAG: sulfatase-like hydrolase/transferase, partial [Deltaproteobacteria bacterium]|nr:sulfatase-like hydrolase/transferase [Deltaproteobacteria bacterium]
MRIKLLLGVLILGLLGYGVFYFYRPSRPHIIFVLVDTLRADHLSMNGYERDTSPNIDAFARENLNFSFAVAAAPWTPASMSSIFTGLYSSVHRMSPPNDRELARRTSSKLSDRFETFPETLRENGFKT